MVISTEIISTGDEVEIISGPMKNQRGRILYMNGNTKVQIAIPSLGNFAYVIVKQGGGEKGRYVN